VSFPSDSGWRSTHRLHCFEFDAQALDRANDERPGGQFSPEARVFPKPSFGADYLAILVDSGGKGSSSIGRRASLPQQFDSAAVRNFNSACTRFHNDRPASPKGFGG
jgi:hypothetical protein